MKTLVLLCGLMLSFVPTVTAQTTALVGARVIDGRGGVIERGTIVVRDGKIAAVGPVASTAVPAGAERIDVSGATIMPGFVNAHGHLTSAVGMRNDPNGGSRENQLRQLKAYAEYGVTTVFSLGDESEAAFQLRREQDKGPFDGARLFLAGPVINGPTADAARALTDKVAAMKPDFIKIRIDDNLGSSRKMPEEAWRATIERAKELKLLGRGSHFLSRGCEGRIACRLDAHRAQREGHARGRGVRPGTEGTQRLLFADVDA